MCDKLKEVANFDETKLREAVANYNAAKLALDAASKELDEVAQSILDEKPSLEAIHELVDIVPPHWRGSRRLYQQIIEKEGGISL